MYTHTHTHTHTLDYYSAISNEEILLLVTTWMNPEGIMLREKNQTEKNKHCMILLIW